MNYRKTLQAYYLITPIFFVIEFLTDVQFRISFPTENSIWLYAYYLVCFGGAFIFFKTDVSAQMFSLIECSVNFVMLILSIWLPLYGLGENVGNRILFEFGVPQAIHFLLLGFTLAILIKLNPLFRPKK